MTGTENENQSYDQAVRIFRGSTPHGKPFTKDLAYTKGVLLIYNYIRIAVQKNVRKQIPAMFVGKTLLRDLHVIADLIDEGLIAPAKYMPPQFSDLAALSSWMSFSLYLNKLDITKLEKEFREYL